MNYREKIEALLDRQDVKGLTKYGHPLEQNPAEMLERLNHLAEELADALRYVCWCMEAIKCKYKVPVSELPGSDRGDRGFGSTGRV